MSDRSSWLRLLPLMPPAAASMTTVLAHIRVSDAVAVFVVVEELVVVVGIPTRRLTPRRAPPRPPAPPTACAAQPRPPRSHPRPAARSRSPYSNAAPPPPSLSASESLSCQPSPSVASAALRSTVQSAASISLRGWPSPGISPSSSSPSSLPIWLIRASRADMGFFPADLSTTAFFGRLQSAGSPRLEPRCPRLSKTDCAPCGDCGATSGLTQFYHTHECARIPFSRNRANTSYESMMVQFVSLTLCAQPKCVRPSGWRLTWCSK
mmetsp:Transcript_20734/g.49302  ORF Transcript_20734/g.49302 Transcript_20734/m.49302 type:complete len:265 (-) Transcript_20734:272-1066(-)